MSSVNHRLFQVFHRFRQMPFSVLLPDEISGNEFTTLMCIGHVGDKDGETAISISALAKKLRVTTPGGFAYHAESGEKRSHLPGDGQ